MSTTLDRLSFIYMFIHCHDTLMPTTTTVSDLFCPFLHNYSSFSSTTMCFLVVYMASWLDKAENRLYPTLTLLGLRRSPRTNAIASLTAVMSRARLHQPRLTSPLLSQQLSLHERTFLRDFMQDVIRMSLQTADALTRTFQDLKSKNEETRVRASHELYSHVALTARGE